MPRQDASGTVHFIEIAALRPQKFRRRLSVLHHFFLLGRGRRIRTAAERAKTVLHVEQDAERPVGMSAELTKHEASTAETETATYVGYEPTHFDEGPSVVAAGRNADAERERWERQAKLEADKNEGADFEHGM